jgi:hypothetical protein
MLEALEQELACRRLVGGALVKLPIGVEERYQRVEVA